MPPFLDDGLALNGWVVIRSGELLKTQPCALFVRKLVVAGAPTTDNPPSGGCEPSGERMSGSCPERIAQGRPPKGGCP